ncbi:MAG: hypothetical protein K6G11_06890, partial [Lachnospiraceae bacterium]|nr:hypothetical protein [Lachnospiraceae bacterium]
MTKENYITNINEKSTKEKKLANIKERLNVDEKISEFKEKTRMDEKISEFKEKTHIDEKFSEFKEKINSNEKLSELKERINMDGKISEIKDHFQKEKMDSVEDTSKIKETDTSLDESDTTGITPDIQGQKTGMTDQESSIKNQHSKENTPSMRGLTAYYALKVAYNLPVIGPLAKNGQIREILNEYEREWKCPGGYVREKLTIGRFNADFIKPEDWDANDGKIILQLHGGGYYNTLHNAYRDVAIEYSKRSKGAAVLCPDYSTAPFHP